MLGAETLEQAALAKTPAYADEGEVRVHGGLEVHVAVAYIYRLLAGNAKLREQVFHGCRGGLAPRVRALTHGKVEQAREMLPDELSDLPVGLIG